MRNREVKERILEALAKSDALTGSTIEELLAEIGLDKASLVLAMALERAGFIDTKRHLVVLGIVNRTIVHDGKSDSARCERCSEALSQENVLGQPVSYSRVNGRYLLAVIPVCSDECGKQLVAP